MGRTPKFVWTVESKAQLINCASNEEMLNTFPMFTLGTLKGFRTKFAKEFGMSAGRGRPKKNAASRVVVRNNKSIASDMAGSISHLIIPDTQVKPGVPTDHLRWIGQYIADKQPDVIIHLGDHWDMPSLSEWDKGKRQFEGRRYRDDVNAGNAAFAALNAPIEAAADYNPRKVFLRGNHEYRIERAVEGNASQLEGIIGYDDLDTLDWEVVDFLEPVWIDGVAYCHYFYNPMNGRAFGGQVATRLKTIGHSFTMGHQQTLDYALRFVGGQSQHGLVAGACYIHDEEYKGPQGNSHWRGIIVKHAVRDGSYNPMFVDLDYLCRRYEGMSLAEYTQEHLTRPLHPYGEWGVR